MFIVKKLRIISLIAIIVLCFVGAGFAATPTDQNNIQIVQSLDLGKTYPYPSSFGLSDYKTTNAQNSIWISCNNDKILISQSALGKVNMIIIREPSATLYGMEIGKTKWNDEIVQNKYFLRQEISPNGKTIYRYYLSDTDKNVLYIALFETGHYNSSLIFTQFEKKYIQ